MSHHRSLKYVEDCYNIAHKLEINDISGFCVLADTHLFMHNNRIGCIQRPRGFKSNKEHDKFIFKSMEESGCKDFLILGDMFWDKTKGTNEKDFKFLKDWMIKNDFHIWLVPGNHDDFEEFKRFLFDTQVLNMTEDDIVKDEDSGLFTIVSPMTQLVLSKQLRDSETCGFDNECQAFPKNIPVILTHYPIMPHQFNNSTVINMCGHLHGGEGFELKGTYTFDMGVDNAIKENGTAYFKFPFTDKIFPDW